MDLHDAQVGRSMAVFTYEGGRWEVADGSVCWYRCIVYEWGTEGERSHRQ